VSEPEYSVVLVDSTSHALRAEKLLNQAGLPNKLIPVPRHLSSDCGSCVRIERGDEARVRELLAGAGLPFSAIEPV
jgi:hypothetical protein